MRLFTLFPTLFTLFIFPVCAQTPSVLSEGTWYKIEITETGVYSIGYNDLQDAGIFPGSVIPQQIAIYGNGGKMLPQANSSPRFSDLQENAIKVTGESDGSFDQGDYIIFYAEGPHTWSLDEENLTFKHEYNIYSESNYYYLRIDQTGGGKRVEEVFNESSGTSITTYNERIFHHKDFYNVQHSGRIWLGEVFDSNLNQTFNFDTPNITGDYFHVKFAVAGRSARYNSTSQESKPFMDVNINGEALDRINFSTNRTLLQNNYSPVTDYRTVSTTLNTSIVVNDLISLQMIYNKNGVLSPGHDIYGGFLDYIEVNFEKELKLNNQQTSFRSFKTLDPGLFTFNFVNTYENLVIFDVTVPVLPKQVNFTSEGDNISLSTEGGEIKEFIAIDGYSQKKPKAINKIQNQDIHGLSFSPELIIVTPKLFLSQAEKLADFHRSYDQMSVLVTTTDEIYNEFSSGKQDVTAIRDFCRYFYTKDNSKLSYLLLFGTGSYDYKDRIKNNINHVPVYQSRESFHPINSYGSDDYFAFLEESEGEWIENSSGNHTMDISVGRLPVKSEIEANTVVEKIIAYCTNNESIGNWRSKVVLFADDYDNNLHLNDCENHAAFIENNFPEINVEKLYIGSYHKETIPGVREYSKDLLNEMKRSVEEGALIFNFVGHGTPSKLAAMVYKEEIDSWKNSTRLPFFITATCEFSVPDNPNINSLGNYIVTKPNGGGIGILSGTRAAYSNANKAMNTQIFKHVFNKDLRIGDVIRRAKNSSFSSVNNRHFTYLGDPAVRLKLPTNNVKLTLLNDQPLTKDTLEALSLVKLSGEVTDLSNTLMSSFNGLVDITLFDKVQKVKTLGEENIVGQKDPIVEYDERKEYLYKGRTTVKNGKFSIEFIVPLSAADSIGSGKISMYAFNVEERVDALGSSDSIWTGGLNESASPDITPPDIQVYIDSITFVSGDSAYPNSILMATLYDESGINMATKDDNHVMLAVLNSDSNIVVSRFYTTDTSDFKKGKINYQFDKLPEGNYSLVLQASDSYNNRGQAQIDFVVYDTITGISHPGITQFLKANAYPNPFSSYTTIKIAETKPVNATVTITDMSGRLIREIVNPSIEPGQGIKWDGTNRNGDKVNKGMYVCKIYLENTDKFYTTILLVQ